MPFEADTTSNASSKSTYTKIEDSNPQTTLDPPVVLIAGAGLGGLMTALLLEKANINYFVFERAAKVKPLGKKIDAQNFSQLSGSKLLSNALNSLNQMSPKAP